MLSRLATVVLCVLLLVLGGLLALVGAFLVPARVLGVPGIAVLIAVVGNVVAGLLGVYGTGSVLGVAPAAVGWAVVAFGAGTQRPEGDLIVPGSLPGDPAVGIVGIAFLAAGIVAFVVTFVVATRQMARAAVRDGAAGVPAAERMSP